VASDEIAVPPKERLGSDEAMAEASLRAQTAEAGEESTIRWSERGALHLPPEHGHFMAQDDNLDSQVVAIAAEKSDELEESEEREVAE
jgi:hypothetical protein